ncbi:transposase [Mycobacterium haemophilum DSM 44634]|nr:hypothetical protein B586_16295 [Mycobacterium haemophilum DSM 44634]
MAARVGIGKNSVAKIWTDHGLKSWKVDTFKVSNDPRFEEKLVNVVGLYLNRPARAVVFCFDEKNQCRALARTQPSLPMNPGRAPRLQMNVAAGEVSPTCARATPAPTYLHFFKQIDATVPRGLAVHVVLDNLSAHSTPEIKKWLAHKDRRRWHLHPTPTPSSWLNLIERWFKELTDKRLRRGGVHQPRRPHRRDHHLGLTLELQPHVLHLEGRHQGHHHQSPTRPRNPQPDQHTDGPPVLAFESADHPIDAWLHRSQEIAAEHGGTVTAAQPRHRKRHKEKRCFGKLALVVAGVLTCRFTHVYPDGPAPYYGIYAGGRWGALDAQWDEIKTAVSEAIIVSALDPAGILNPGLLVDL